MSDGGIQIDRLTHWYIIMGLVGSAASGAIVLIDHKGSGPYGLVGVIALLFSGVSLGQMLLGRFL